MNKLEELELRVKKLREKSELEKFQSHFLKYEISLRECEVLREVLKGLTNKQIANLLYVSEKTIKFHLTNIYMKLDVKSRSLAIVKALPLTLEVV